MVHILCCYEDRIRGYIIVWAIHVPSNQSMGQSVGQSTNRSAVFVFRRRRSLQHTVYRIRYDQPRSRPSNLYFVCVCIHIRSIHVRHHRNRSRKHVIIAKKGGIEAHIYVAPTSISMAGLNGGTNWLDEMTRARSSSPWGAPAGMPSTSGRPTSREISTY